MLHLTRFDKFVLGAVVILMAAVGWQIKQANSRELNVSIREVPYFMFPPGASARMINVPPPVGIEAQQAAARADALWVEYCNPKIVVDAFGVGRYQYSKAGCEFGRSAD